MLQRDPAGVYSQMDFRSRDRYRHAVEELALPTGEAQLLLALKSVERARQVHVRTPDDRASHVGYHLIGPGRRSFERSVAWQPDVSHRVRRLFFAWATPIYLGSVAAGTALLVAAAVGYAAWHGWRGAALAFVALLTTVPASELVIQLLQRLISYLIPPRRLPRIELEDVPPVARTMVIVPTLLDSVERVEELIAHLEVQALGNLDPRIHFALLSDFPDAATETQPQDAGILDAVTSGIAALNVKHGNGDGSRFFLFHRLRQWNDGEGLWMGWERKRGKIEEFNRLLRGATDTSFAVSVGDLSILPDVKYCITLDSDTRLPRGVARELIGIIVRPPVSVVFSSLLKLLRQVPAFKNLQQGLPAAKTTTAIADFRKQANALIDFMLATATKTASRDELLSETLDGISFALSHDVKRIFDSELKALNWKAGERLAQGKVAYIQGLLTNCLQQSIITLAPGIRSQSERSQIV